MFHEEEDSSTADSMDLNQVLEIIRNDFSSKISEVLEAIQDVKKDVRDFATLPINKTASPHREVFKLPG